MASSGPEKADCSQIISSTSPGGVPGDSGGSSTRPTLKITLLGSEWNSSAGGLSTFNRELAIHLSEHPQVDVTLLVPEGACKDEEKNEARRYGVNVVDAKFQAGFDPLYWLSCPPKDLHIDIVIGHGIKLGPQVQIIRNCVQFSTCKWVQVVHTAPEDLSKFKSYSDPTSKGEKKNQDEVDLCKRADLVMPVGPRLTESCSAHLRRWKEDKDIFSFTPGLFEREFGGLEQVANNNEDFKVLIVGRGDTEDFELKGLDIAAKAFADKRLKHKPYELTFVGAPDGKQEEVRERLLRCGIAKEQLTVRRFVQSRDRLKDLLCEADLAIMPSKSEGFGLVAVEALSAGLPILVGSRSGFAKALKGVVHGHSCVVHSDDPAKWAEAIEEVRDRHGMRLKEIQALKASYGEMYSWKKQCEALVERMWQIVPGNENWNISKSKASVEKHDAAGRTSEQQLHSVKERRRTLGTKKDESSPKKEPPEDLFRSSQVESTSDPGFVSTSLRLVITAQDLDVKQQEFIDGTLKSQIQAYTTYHDLSTPGSVGAFIEHITKAYNLAVQAVESGSLIVTVQCFTLEGLERLWNDYRSGCLNDIAERFLVTSELKRKLNLENFRLTITIEEENYLICKKTLMEKIESSIWSTVPNSVHRKTIDDIDDKGEMPKHMYEFGIRRKLKSPASTKMATGKAKSLDKMRMRELTEILEVLGLSDEGVENLSDATCRIRSALNAAEKMSNWSPGKAFSVLSEAKGEDVRRRCELIEFYTTAETILDKMHEHMITLLQKHIPNVKEDMKLHIKQLKEEEYYLLFAGETSSGKSSLINLILGEEILPYSHKCCTSTICELKFGDERRLVVHFKDKDHPETELPTEEIFLAQPTESFSYLDQIFSYVHVKNDSGNKGSVVKKVELFWPHSLLQTGLVIIDSPGVGESDEMDKMVVQYLPKAFAFVYVINSANAGGIQKDRLEKLLVMARDMSLGDPNQEREEGGLTSVMEEDPLSKCALFVCNKWEQVPEQEVQSVKDDTVKKLGKVWPGIDPESQITHMSTARAVTAQNLGVITEEFSSVMDGIKSVILMSIEAKLELHWNWLHRFLTTIVIHAKVFLENASNTHDDINQKMENVIHRLDVMKRGQRRVIQDLQASFNEKVHTILCQLSEYLDSEDAMARFTSWSENEFPDQYISALTPEVEEKIDTLLSSRFQEVVKQWEEENHVFTDARLSLVKKVKNCYDEAEFQRRNLLFDATDVHRGVSNFQKFRFSIPRKAYMKIRILTFGVFGLVAKSMNVTFITELYGGSKIDFKDVISQASVKFLCCRREKRQLKKFVEGKLNDVKDCLGQIEVRLPELIEEERQLYSELYGQLLCNLERETHFQEENKDRYRRIRDEGSQCRDQLALFGIKNVCTTKINHEELEWKEEKSSLLGSGSFSAVYQGTMRRCSEVATVALKVFNEALNADNASEIMQEMKMLRILKHPHIVQFYGLYLDMSSPMSTRVIFVMEKCKGNLRNHIFRELESTPGRSKKATTVNKVCHWVKQIIDGLAHIHELGVVHGDFKLENILLSEDNTVKISDVGLAKAETDITGTFKGTPVYMAPEVFHFQVYDSKADIYSLGLLMWEMWYGQRAFADTLGTTPQGLFDWVDKGNRPVHKQGCKTPPSFWEQLMKQCWDGNPDKRPTAKECNERITVCLNSPGAGLYKVYEKVAELASEEGMDEKTDDETKTETEDTAEEKKVTEERMVKSGSKVESLGVLTEESEKDSEVHEKVAELASEEGVDEKTDDETKTETEDDAEEKKVIEVESGAMITSKVTCWASKEWAVHLMLPPDAVSERTSIVVHRWEYSVLSPPLQEYETITSNVIELSSINGQELKFNTKVKLSLSHSATDLWGYELVIKNLTDKKTNKWEDLNGTRDMCCGQDVEDSHPSHMKIPECFFPVAQADISECSAYAVVCRLKASPTYTITSAGGSFSHPDFPGVTVTIPENAVAPNAKFPLELMVQEVSNEEFKGEGIFLGPVLRIKCYEAVQFLKPVNIQLPISLREQQDLNLNPTKCHVRVLFLKSDGDQKEWIEITDDLVKPPSLDGKFVRFHVERFSAYSHYVEESTEHFGFNGQTIQNFHNSRIFVQPRLTVFFAYFRPDLLKILRLMCCPAHLKGEVEMKLAKQCIRYVCQNSKEDMTPGYDKAYVNVWGGIEPSFESHRNEIYLRLLENHPDDAELEVCFVSGEEVARVEFYRNFTTGAPPLCRLHLRTPTHGTDRSNLSELRQQPSAIKEGSPTDYELQQLSTKVSNGWRTLGRRLTFQEAELQEFDNGHQQISEKAYAMLLAWKQRGGSAATYSILHQALCNTCVNRRDLAQEFCCYIHLLN